MISIGLAVVMPQAAVADCVEFGPDGNGLTRVDCTGVLSPGYIADPGLENLLLQFDENALVRDDVGNDAVLVNSLTNVSNHGSISIDLPGHAGINVRDGQIQVLLRNEEGASIQVGSQGTPVDDGFGMRVGDGSGVVNDEVRPSRFTVTRALPSRSGIATPANARTATGSVHSMMEPSRFSEVTGAGSSPGTLIR